MPRRRAVLTLSIGLLTGALAACGEARPVANTGETNCQSCHGYPPSSGAHLAHAEGRLYGRPFSCEQCHKDVQNVNDPDHIVRANGTPVPPPAEVRFDDGNALAGVTDPANARSRASFIAGNKTCSNVYCHGAFRGGIGVLPVSWTATSAVVACGTCHPIPPSPPTHPAITTQNCGECHPGYSATPGSTTGTTNPAVHINGRIDLR